MGRGWMSLDSCTPSRVFGEETGVWLFAHSEEVARASLWCGSRVSEMRTGCEMGVYLHIRGGYRWREVLGEEFKGCDLVERCVYKVYWIIKVKFL